MDLELLEHTLADLGQPSFRRGQVWEWAARGAASYAEMTNLPEALRPALEERVPFSSLALEREAVSSDGTEKALFRTGDGRPVEAVLMRYRDGRRSLCLSSQSGCPLTCTFCATGSMQFGRNLTTSEILDQALHFRRKEAAGGAQPDRRSGEHRTEALTGGAQPDRRSGEHRTEALTGGAQPDRRSGEHRTDAMDHAVFMGMGEPLLNLDAVLGACDRLPSIGIHASSTTISTVGWVPGIDRLADREGATVRLALSLHAPDDALRSELMPVNERYPLAEVLDACRRWNALRRRKVYVEYVMLAGVNDRYAQAVQLADLLGPRGPFKVNLIPYNPTDSPFEGSSREAIAAFAEALESRGVPATVRLTRGRDIAAACGQLAAQEGAASSPRPGSATA